MMKRIFHPYWEWECWRAGMYRDDASGVADGEKRYREFLLDDERFREALEKVLTNWPVSCEQFLSNKSINRLAWLGQAAMCVATGVPRGFRGGFKLLTPIQQERANKTAAEFLTRWALERNESPTETLW